MSVQKVAFKVGIIVDILPRRRRRWNNGTGDSQFGHVIIATTRGIRRRRRRTGSGESIVVGKGGGDVGHWMSSRTGKLNRSVGTLS